jgi:hypothetical protein
MKLMECLYLEEIKRRYEIVGVWDKLMQVQDKKTMEFYYYSKYEHEEILGLWMEVPMTSIKSEFFVKGE